MENKPKQELDMTEIIKMISQWFMNALNYAKYCIIWHIRHTYKYMLWLALFIAIGVLYGLYNARECNRKYVTETEIRINVTDAYYVNNIIKSLNNFCLNYDYAGLAKNLQISEADASTICMINSYFYIDDLNNGTPDRVIYSDYVPADTLYSKMQDRLQLQVMLTDTSRLNGLLDKIINHLASNVRIYSMNIERLRQIDLKIYNIENEIYLLDSLRRNEYFSQPKNKIKFDGTLVYAENHKQLYHDVILSLEREKDNQEWLKTVAKNPIQVTTDLVVCAVTNQPLPMAKQYGFLALILGYLLTLAYEYRGAVIAFLKDSDKKDSSNN